jgi:DNA-binding transcriptional LysR family regulator
LIIVPPEGTDPALTTQVVLQEDLVVASAEPPVNRPTIRLIDLRDRPMVMFRQGYDLRETTLQACRAVGYEPKLAIEGGEMDAVLRFVEVGLGVAIVPRMVLAGRPNLIGTPIAPPGLQRTVALAHRTDVPPTNAARAFSEILLDYLKNLD